MAKNVSQTQQKSPAAFWLENADIGHRVNENQEMHNEDINTNTQREDSRFYNEHFDQWTQSAEKQRAKEQSDLNGNMRQKSPRKRQSYRKDDTRGTHGYQGRM